MPGKISILRIFVPNHTALHRSGQQSKHHTWLHMKFSRKATLEKTALKLPLCAVICTRNCDDKKDYKNMFLYCWDCWLKLEWICLIRISCKKNKTKTVFEADILNFFISMLMQYLLQFIL